MSDETDDDMASHETQAAALVRTPVRAVIGAALALMLTAVAVVSGGTPARAADYPGWAEVQAAKAAVRDANATAAQLDAAIVSLSNAVHEADVAVRAADDAYAEAQERNERAQLELFYANARADEAARALDKARASLAEVARAEYRTGGDFGALEAVTKSDGFADVVAKTEALNRAGNVAELAIERVRAAELVEATLRAFADDAAKSAVLAETDAKQKLLDAIDLSREVEQALAEAELARDQLIEKLAALRRTSSALERARQESLAAARQAAAEREAQRRASAASTQSSGSSTSTTSSGSSEASNVVATGGTSVGTAEKGQAAVNFALAQLGEMYLYGAAGPDRWDCSGLTMVAWGNQGVYLPRSSKSQYSYVGKVPYSALRAGDLIFWGSGGSPSAVYHVAMYVGNNIIVEATKTGYPVKTRDYRNWAAGDRMAYAGRP